MHFDVAIVGTGPAGGIAALSLAGSGLKVALIEKEKLPRPKACGGLMPAAVSRLLGESILDDAENRIDRLSYTNNYQEPVIKKLPQKGLILVDRARFDMALVDNALEVGHGNVCLVDGYSVNTVEENARGIVLHSKGGQTAIRADFLIAADGAASKTARCLHLNPSRQLAPAIDAELVVTSQQYENFAGSIFFDYFCLPGGYGWIFPKANGTLSCGVGSWAGARGIRSHLDEYLRRNLKQGQIKSTSYRGHPIPIFSGDFRVCSERTCLAGDAASLADPTSGEGIRFALLSGKLAADTVAKAAEGNGNCKPYSDRLATMLDRSLMQTLRFASLPFRQAPDLYYRRFIGDSKNRPHYH